MTTKQTKLPYIHLDFEEALQLKWEAGATKHRQGKTGFQGDPAAELMEELLDAIWYVREIEAGGAELPGYETTLKNMARALQARERELRKRIY